MSSSPIPFLDNYESLDVIGNGSFGIIRKVRRKSDGILFARKELNFERMTERDRKQIVAEVNILKDLHHDHIVRYHDRYVDRDAGILYILMEYCGGGDLSTVIKQASRSGRLIAEETIWSYFYQILHALQYCHHPNGHSRSSSGNSTGIYDNIGQGARRPQILHRDLKPDNVFLDEDNRVKLGDFGLSKALPQASFASTYVGTPYYMSPELMQEKAYDSKSDIWSLGCLMFELCALKPPFHEAKTHSELSIFIRNGRIPPLPRGYSQALNSVIRSMLNLNPAMRPSAATLLQTERLELVSKVQETEKMLSAVKQHRSAVAAKEREVLAREAAFMETQSRLQALVTERDAQIAALQRHIAQQQNTPPAGTYTYADVQSAAKAAVAAREDELRKAVMQREAEVAQAIAAREQEIMEAVRAREAEFDAAAAAREQELTAAFETRAAEMEAHYREMEDQVRVVLEREEFVGRREEELRKREEALLRDETRVEEVKRAIEKGKDKEVPGRKVNGTKARKEKSPLEEVKNVLLSQATPVQAQQTRARRVPASSVQSSQSSQSSSQSSESSLHQSSPTIHSSNKVLGHATHKSVPSASSHPAFVTPAAPRSFPSTWEPMSAMKGVVLTTTGETLATPAPGDFQRRLAAVAAAAREHTQQTPLRTAMAAAIVTPRPKPVELGALFEKSPKVGLNFGKIFDHEKGKGTAKPELATLNLDAPRTAALHDHDDDAEEMPPSPSIRTHKPAMERSRTRRNEDRDDVSEASSASSGATTTTNLAVPPPTRIRKPSIRSSSRSSNGRSAAAEAAVACVNGANAHSDHAHAPKPLPLPHPHLRASKSKSELRATAASGSGAVPVLPAPPASAPAIPSARASAYKPAPVYDMADEDNLPSPFLRRAERVDKGLVLKAAAVAAAASVQPVFTTESGTGSSGSAGRVSMGAGSSQTHTQNLNSDSTTGALSSTTTTTTTTTTSASTKTKKRPSSGLLLRAVAAANSASRRSGHSPVLSESPEYEHPENVGPGGSGEYGSSGGNSNANNRPTLATARRATEDARKALLRP